MASKAQAIARLRKVHPDAEFIFEDACGNWNVRLIAPSGMNWSGDSHEIVLNWSACPGDRPRFWDEVIEDIGIICDGSLQKCSETECPSIVDGECEYWDAPFLPEYCTGEVRKNFKEIKDCPRCKGRLPDGYPGALSRCDGRTELCSACGREEGLEAMREAGIEC